MVKAARYKAAFFFALTAPQSKRIFISMTKRKTVNIAKFRVNIDVLKKYQIGILGYGSQGRAQALNLKDSGLKPTIGLPAKSRSRNHAKKDGFTVITPAKLCQQCDLIAVLVPDHKHQELFTNELYSIMKPGQVFIFAHGLSVHFHLVKQPSGVDFILVAPHSPGIGLREKYIEGKSITAFIGNTEKSSPISLKLAKSYAQAIGCPASGLIQTSFADEAIGDIFGEQAVLCGGLSALLKAGFNTLVKAGLPPENAYLECIYQIDLIVDLIKRHGIDGMYDRISTTAAYGAAKAEPKIIDSHTQEAMAKLLKEIKSGKFTANLMNDYHKEFTELKKQRKKVSVPILDNMAKLFAEKLGI